MKKQTKTKSKSLTDKVKKKSKIIKLQMKELRKISGGGRKLVVGGVSRRSS